MAEVPEVAAPRLAVVGHPNKGKSCIVSTLAHDDSVLIGELPGTTTRCRSYPMKVDGETLYVLVDTPGLQQSLTGFHQQMRAWLRTPEEGADTITWLATEQELDGPDGRLYLGVLWWVG